jgi:hypothetical protein
MFVVSFNKKGLKMPSSESVNRRKTDKQRSTKHTHKTKDRATQTPLRPGIELRCSGREST